VIVHATSVARRLDGGWAAALLFGASGAGKSDLALRALQAGWRLVSDDYTVVWASGGGVFAKAPETIQDRIEARGLGLLAADRLPFARAGLAVTCEPGGIERLPEPETLEVAGLPLPHLRLHALEASALFKLDRALSTRPLGGGAGSAYLGPSRTEPVPVPRAEVTSEGVR